jgi:hypothetical protein
MARYATRRAGRQVRRETMRHTKSGGAVTASEDDTGLGVGFAAVTSCCLALPFVLVFLAIMIFLIAGLAQRCG